MSDTAPALFCLNASVTIVGSDGVRQVEIEKIYSHDPLRPISLKPDEIVTRIIIPEKEGPSGCGFAKFTMRGGIEFAAVNVGVFIEAENDLSTCKRARITVGAVSEAPQRAKAVETLLQGKSLSNDTLKAAARKIADPLKIVPHHGYSKGFLVECLKTETKSALTEAAKAITGTKVSSGERKWP